MGAGENANRLLNETANNSTRRSNHRFTTATGALSLLRLLSQIEWAVEPRNTRMTAAEHKVKTVCAVLQDSWESIDP
jgi:hypothetical protein